jgi:type VI protein secretion system component VasK
MNTQAAILTAKIVAGIAGALFVFVMLVNWSPAITMALFIMGCLAVAIYCLYKVVCLELEMRESDARRKINRESRQKELERKTQAYVNQIKGMK